MENSGQINRSQLFKKTRQHFGLPATFKPLVHIALSYVGKWEIRNYQGDSLGVSDEQRAFMLETIEQRGGFEGSAL